ncbi:MAG: DHH family phosphoesterase [Thermoplasmata archaeon]|nr:MAG: DHH family phosphoesterase [Thermoplasmata archaeon]
MKLEEGVRYAADLLLSLPKKTMIRVISHIDADGIASASIIALALQRAGYRYHISIKRTDPNLMNELEKENDLIIFADIGSGYLREMENIKSNIIILEHHLSHDEPPSNVMYINARLYGIDGSKEACGASVCYAFAKAIDEGNVDLSQLAIIGMIGDKQHFEGYNKQILDEAIGNGYVETRDEYIFTGRTLKDALENSIEPYFTNFQNANHFIEEIGLEPQKNFDEIDEGGRKKLLSALTIKLIEQGCNEIEWKRKVVYGKYYGNLYDMASKFNASARMNESGVGIAAGMGDKRAVEKLFILQEKYRDEIRKEMRSLEKKEAHEMKKYLYFYTEKPPLSGVLAGLAVKYLPNFNKGKPVLAMAYNNNTIEISSRANNDMVENGINLGIAMRKAAMAAGGSGGGHPIAAGATIPRENEKIFLEELDSCL